MEEGSRRVLVADDERIVGNVLGRLLPTLGSEADVVTTGDAAVAKVAADTDGYNVVLLDVSMPGMATEDVVRQIHAHAPSLPIVLMSGHDPELIRKRFATFAIAGFLAKPFQRRELEETLQHVLQATSSLRRG